MSAKAAAAQEKKDIRERKQAEQKKDKQQKLEITSISKANSAELTAVKKQSEVSQWIAGAGA